MVYLIGCIVNLQIHKSVQVTSSAWWLHIVPNF